MPSPPRTRAVLLVGAVALALAGWMAWGRLGDGATVPPALGPGEDPGLVESTPHAEVPPARLERADATDPVRPSPTPPSPTGPEAETDPAWALREPGSGSPFALFGTDPDPQLELYLPTWDNFLRSFSEGYGLTEEQCRDLWAIDEARQAFVACRQLSAAGLYVLRYEERERERFRRHQPSVPLEDELLPAMPFLRQHLEDPAAFEASVRSHSMAMIEQLQRQGVPEGSNGFDDARDRWTPSRILGDRGQELAEAHLVPHLPR